MLKRILLPLDGSQLAERALPHAVKCAQATQSCLTIAHVLPTSDVYIDIPSVDPLDWRLRKMEANLYLEEIASLLAQRDVMV
jgi:nucleotide-binding universal stress UspA family protein